jgi:hypothetical protein
MKYTKGIEEAERIEVSIPLEQFEHEARDFSNHNVTDFFSSSLFKKDYLIEDRQIKTTTRI